MTCLVGYLEYCSYVAGTAPRVEKVDRVDKMKSVELVREEGSIKSVALPGSLMVYLFQVPLRNVSTELEPASGVVGSWRTETR